MKKIAFLLILLVCQNGLSQDTRVPKSLLSAMEKLDIAMQNNDSKIVELLTDDVSFGHSNGWVQNLSDFKKDFNSKKVSYKSIAQIEISEVKSANRIFSIRRKVAVSGIYKTYEFSMNLALLEIWKKRKGKWKLWSRQAIELKNN